MTISIHDAVQMAGNFLKNMKRVDSEEKLPVDKWKAVDDQRILNAVQTLLFELEEIEDEGVQGLHNVRALKLLEEAAEYVEAHNEETALDGLTDAVYVAAGTAACFDFPLQEAFIEVHRSNMTKTNSAGTLIVRDKGETYEPADLERVLKSHRERVNPERINMTLQARSERAKARRNDNN